MKIRTLTMIGAGLALATGIVTTTLWHELRAAQAATARLRIELAESVARAAVAPVPPVEAAAPAAATAAPPDRPKPPPAPVSLPSSEPAVVGTIRIGGQDLVLVNDPESRKVRLAMLRTNIAQSYPGLVDELGLTKGEADHLFDLLADSQMNLSSSLALVLSGDGQTDPTNAAEIARGQSALRRQQNDAIRALLGDVRYAQWQDYQQTRPVRTQASTYAAALARAGSPLDDAQFRTLMTAMVGEEKNMQQAILALGRTVSTTNPETRVQALDALQNLQGASNQRIFDAASSQLNAQQMSLLRAEIEQRAAIDAAAARFRTRNEAAQ